jgi:enolase
MNTESRIVSITAREVFSSRTHPGVEATVITENGGQGVAIATGGTSLGGQEAKFVYDSDNRFFGKGVQQAVDNVNNIIGPALKGMNAAHQSEIDELLIGLDGTPDKSRLGANATGSVSAAVLKAGAASLGIPLYQHIGGINACILPVPGIMAMLGARRYGGGQQAGCKPTYSIMCYGFDSFREANYAGWEAFAEYIKILALKLNLHYSMEFHHRMVIDSGVIKHDRELWEIMAETIANLGYEGKMGIQVDVAATTYYDAEKKKYIGIFSGEDKTRKELMDLYKEMVKNYPFVILEDPLEETDFEGFATLTKELGIEIVGDDLFASNIEKVKKAAELGAANAVLLKVYQKGTITEAADMIQFAYRHGYGIQPCGSRGEGVDIADYAVGFNTGHLREGAIDETGNRLLKIEIELGNRARFLGKEGLKLAKK